ncbi:hypothetical protein ACIP10_30960 [Streptomyces galbus]|uniref:hypothetical protein n=1 Tax=Streptomyces galbus TaxID=33898 RepID=UPI00380F14B0
MTDTDSSAPTIRGASTAEKVWAGLSQMLAGSGGYRVLNIESLVNFEGAQRAGANIIKRIEQRLAEANIGHLPTRLPTDSTCKVLLYNRDQPNVGFLIRLIHDLAIQEVGDDTNASVLRLQAVLDAERDLKRLDRKADGR